MSMITILNIDTLRNVLVQVITPSTLQVCQQWRDIIIALPDDIVAPIVNAMVNIDVLQVPASMYRLLTLEHQIAVPNKLIDVITDASRYKYPMAWRDIVALSRDNLKTTELCRYVLTNANKQGLTGSYFIYMFTNYEQYRRHISSMDISMPIYLAQLMSRGSFTRTRIDFAEAIWLYCSRDLDIYASISSDLIAVGLVSSHR